MAGVFVMLDESGPRNSWLVATSNGGLTKHDLYPLRAKAAAVRYARHIAQRASLPLFVQEA